ncbi:MAG: ABC transporter substrate-binding protein [Actinomycetota bacterium]
MIRGRSGIAVAAGVLGLALVASGCYSSQVTTRRVTVSRGEAAQPTVSDSSLDSSPGAAIATSGASMGPAPSTRTGEAGVGSAPGGATDVGLTANTIKIGYVGDFSGQARAFFGPALDTLNAYIADINSRGGIHGRKARLVYYSANYQSPDQVLSAVRRLVEQDKVFVVVMLVSLDVSAGPAVAYLNEKGVPCLGCRSSAQTDLALGPSNFVTQIDPASHGEILGGFVAKRLNKKYMAVGYCESANDKNLAMLAAASFERHGGKVVDKRSIGNCTQTSMESPVAAWYSTVPRPDVLMIIDPIGMAEGTAAARRMGWNVQVTGRSGWFQLVLDIGGSQTEGLIATTEGYACPGYQSPQWNRFRQVLKAYYPDRKEEEITVEAWSSLGLLEEAARRAGPNLTRRGLVQAVEGMSGFDDGMGPKFAFGPGRHWGRSSTGFYMIHNQAFVKATPEDFFTVDDL